MNFVGKNEETSLYELLNKFFSSAPIKSRFKFIGEKGYFGWEKWIQIELPIPFMIQKMLLVTKLQRKIVIHKIKEQKILESGSLSICHFD